jgi:hypothetical protein
LGPSFLPPVELPRAFVPTPAMKLLTQRGLNSHMLLSVGFAVFAGLRGRTRGPDDFFAPAAGGMPARKTTRHVSTGA